MSTEQNENEFIFLSPPHQTGKELAYLQEVLESNYLAPVGPMLNAFEADFTTYTDIPHCAAVSSGTAALHLALLALGITKGDHVWVSTLTFMGGVSPILYQGAIPTFIDSSKTDWTLCPILLKEALAEAAENGTLPKAVIVTDIYGQCCDYAAIRAACEPYNIAIISDSAEAMGAFRDGKHAGYHADIAIFSFNGNKIMTTSGGGMIASHNKEWIERARYLATQAKQPELHYEHTELGYNYRMSNLIAAIGRAQLEQLTERVAIRRDIFSRYQEELGTIDGIRFIPEAEGSQMNCWLTVMLLDPAQIAITPHDLCLALKEKNIEARPVWKPMHQQPVFAEYHAITNGTADTLFATGICLPSGSSLTKAQQERIITTLKSLIQ